MSAARCCNHSFALAQCVCVCVCMCVYVCVCVCVCVIMVVAGHVCYKKLLDQHGQPYRQGSDLIIRSEEVRNVNDTMTFAINGRGLDKMDWIGSSDPYLQFYRLLADQSWALMHTTESMCVSTRAWVWGGPSGRSFSTRRQSPPSNRRLVSFHVLCVRARVCVCVCECECD